VEVQDPVDREIERCAGIVVWVVGHSRRG
jgi:hypothetical protein